jgi:hypothetical protein
MNRQNRIPLARIFCLWLVVFIQFGCKNTISMELGKDGKIILNPQNNDVIKWYDTLTLQPTFLGVTPCVEGKTINKECTVSIPGKYGHYRYVCTGCTDPEVEVGSVGIEKHRQSHRIPLQVNQYVAIPCESNAITLDPSEFSVHANDVIEWEPEGSGTELLNDWTVTPTTFCATPVTEQQPDCKFTPTGTTPINYTVTSKGCTTAGSGKIDVLP